MTTKAATRELIDAGVANLRRLRDEIALELHLGGMDTKDVWAELEGKLRGFEHELSKKTTEWSSTLTTSIEELETRFEQLRAKLRQ